MIGSMPLCALVRASGMVVGEAWRTTTASGARTNTSAPIGAASRLATLAPLTGVAGSAEVKVVAAARIATMDLKPNIVCGAELLVGKE